MLRKDLGQVNRMRRNELQNEMTKEKLERKYRFSVKGLGVVHEELQQRLVAIGAKLERYDNRTEQYRQNRLFEANQKKLFSELEGGHRETIEPDAAESTRFWRNIWDKPERHNEDAAWLKDFENELLGIERQENIQIVVQKVRKQTRRMPNWKSPDPDGVQGYWIKNLTNTQEMIANQLGKCLQENDVPL